MPLRHIFAAQHNFPLKFVLAMSLRTPFERIEISEPRKVALLFGVPEMSDELGAAHK
ncbi:MAG TPA: hypothetical protein VGG12_01100 [Methylovirgula sp.]|jgi:hypothetical protein